jgi:hypothetical protein
LIWLYILLALILLILLVGVIPVSLIVRWHEELKCTLKVGLIPITIYPQKAKKTKKKKSKEPSKPKQNKPEEKKEKNLLKEKGLGWFVNLIKKVADLAKGALKDLFKHILIKEFMLSVKVAGEDAADTAVKYGYLCSAIYPATGLIIGAVNYKSYGVDITPDFEENAQSQISLDLNARIFTFRLLSTGIKHSIKGIKLLLKLRELGE